MSRVISNFEALCAVAAAGGAWLTWLLVRQYFFKSPLDNIPGPKRASLIAGTVLPRLFSAPTLRRVFTDSRAPGNMSQLFEKHCWPFLDELTDRYGGVVKLHGLFGVRATAHRGNALAN